MRALGALHKGQDVVLGDAATGSAACHLAQIHIVFGSQFAHQRRASEPLRRLRSRARLPPGSLAAVTAGVSAEADAFAAAGAAAVAAAAAPPITATTLLTCTVLPVSALISVSTPETGAGISASTLSVEISNSGSSRVTCSPTFFSHLVIVPSKIDSPICGITTSVAGPPARCSDR